MKKFFLSLLLAIAPATVLASGAGCGELPHCEHAPVNLHDKASLQHGAQLFLSYCSGCHSASTCATSACPRTWRSIRSWSRST